MKIKADRMKKSFGITLGLSLTAIGVISLSGGVYAQVQSNLPSLPAQPVISGPLSLKDAVQTALKYSPMVRSASSMAEAARARVGMNRAMTRPQLSISAFGGTSSMGDIITSPPNVMPSGIFAVPDKSGVTGQAGLMFPIYTGGRLSGAVRGSKAL
ncbi:MAG TPA: TolC family protein, partial [Armatimonadota bacterium]